MIMISRGLLVRTAIGLVMAATVATGANALSVLYRNDSNQGTDYLAQALSSYSPTTTTGNLSGFTLSSYDIVVYANQNSSVPGGDIAAIDSYISGGGKVIFTNWLSEIPSTNAAFSGNTNLTDLTLSPLFSAGIAGGLTAVNPGWGIFTQGLLSSGGTIAATWENGDAAIVVGNGGRTIANGFLTDTVASSTLYANQIAYLTGSGSPGPGAGAVPEPASWAMMIAGFGLVGGSMRYRRGNRTVSFA